jgi:membrane-associated HD superfamily phosphohydrolase
MLCDCLEAKCKALSQVEKLNDIKKVVSETFDELMENEQLDEIGLPKVSYIRIIKQILTRELNSIYQSKRIDYDVKPKLKD